MTTVLITGASRGMGAETARRLATDGALVLAGLRDPDTLGHALELPAGATGEIRPVRLDVTDDESVARAVLEVGDQVPAIDVLVNNAGVPGPWDHPAAIGPEHFTAVLETNLLGPVRVTRAFLPLLRRGRQPRLVMVSSGMGSLGLQSGDEVYRDIAHLPYPASKAALNMVTVQYAKALPEVVVTAVDPGLTATEFTDGAGHSTSEGAEVILTAALDTTGPSGRFLDRNGTQPW